MRNKIYTLLIVLITLMLVSVLWVIVLRFQNPVVTYLMVKKYFTSECNDCKFQHQWVSINNISPKMLAAVVASEDQNFYEHNGFDFDAIEDAWKYNHRKNHKRKTRGASTISQQVAKNVFLFPERTWIRKGLEVYFTILIETFWSKQRIIEVYLNVAELGRNVYGVEAASHLYFQKRSLNLSKAEAATIAAVIPNPIKMSAYKPSAFVERRKSWIMNQMDKMIMN